MASHLASPKNKNEKDTADKAPLLPRVVRIKPQKRGSVERVFSIQELAVLGISLLLYALASLLRVAEFSRIVIFAMAALLAAFTPALRCVRCLARGEWPNEEPFVLLAVVLAFCIGEYAAGTMAMILYRAGELAQGYALLRGEAAAAAMSDLLPDKAWVEHEDELREVLAENVQVGDVVRVEVGKAIPLDGEILEGATTVDPSPLTGSAGVRSAGPGDEVASGCINVGAPIRIRVLRSFEQSAAAGLVNCFAGTDTKRSRMEKRIRRYSGYYLLAVAVLALIIGVLVPILNHHWAEQLRRMVIFLLLTSPAAVLVTVPLAFQGALLSAGRRGILIKGKHVVEKLARSKTFVFGKTGTITEGKYTITDVFPSGVSEKELLMVAAVAESHSRHPIALALKQAAGWTRDMGESVLDVEETPGRGVSAFIEGRHVYVGNADFLAEHGIWYKVPNRAGAAVHVAVENEYWGHVMVSDRVREGAFDALETLRNLGVGNLVMLTGDVLSVSRPIASSLSFDLVKAELTPSGKLSAIDYLRQGISDGSCIAYVGDGINDGPLFERANVGIAVNALEKNGLLDSADVAVLDDDIMAVTTGVKICGSAYRIAWENLLFTLGLRLILLLLAAVGVLPILTAALLEFALNLLTSVNALRAFLLR